MNNKIDNNKGFSIMEIMVSLSLFVVVTLLVGVMYQLSQRSYNTASNRGELIQNARVALDRISRELRQSSDVVSILPSVNNDPDNPAINEIFFQDGHSLNQTTYVKYYLSGTDLRRSVIAYFFEDNPGLYVSHDSTDSFGNSPNEIILEDNHVGEYFNNLQFWGNGLVHYSMELEKGGIVLDFGGQVFSRN